MYLFRIFLFNSVISITKYSGITEHGLQSPSTVYLTFAYLPTASQPTNSMQQSPSWEANMSSASQEIPRILRNPGVHYRIHRNQPPILILGQMNSVHPLPLRFFKIHFNIILPYTPKSSKSSPSLKPSQPYPVCISPLPHTCYTPMMSSIFIHHPNNVWCWVQIIKSFV